MPETVISPASLLVLAGPSCVGKDALLSRLLVERPELMKPVTTTTRPQREHEIDGVHYHFLERAAFEAAVRRGEFLEHACIHGDAYGLGRSALAVTVHGLS